MAATLLTKQTVTLGLNPTTGVYTGKVPTFANTTDPDAGGSGLGGDKAIFADPEKGWFEVENLSGSIVYAKVVCKKANAQGHKIDVGDASSSKGMPIAAVSSGNPGRLKIGPFDDQTLRDTDGSITVQCSAFGSNVKIAAFELGSKGRG